MTLRTLLVAAILTALGVGTIVAMYFDSQSGSSPSLAEAPPVIPASPEPNEIEAEETVAEEPPPPTEYAASELPIEEEIVTAFLSEPAPANEPASMPVSSESAASSLLGQVSQEEIAKAYDMLGQLLGLPEVSPEELKRKVEKVGLLRFRRDVPVDFMSRDELSSYIQDLFDTEYTPETAEREERVLRALGFLSPGQDLRDIRARVLNENIAGFYDERPHVRRLFAISSSSGRKLNLMNQLILSHELRHAIQDQHLDLGRVLGKMSDYDDRRLAALSLIEGDATLLMEKYMASGQQQEGGTGLEGLLGGLGGGMMDGRSMAEMFAGPELRSAPPVVREQLLVPYLEGRRLAGEIFEKGGFRSLNERLQKLPRSMEQVLHPEKYLDRVDEPIDVSLVGMSGANVESEGQIGELFVRTLLEATLPEAEGIEAAAGWGGDHYALWTNDGQYHLIWRTVWDTDRDAGEFFDALVRFASVKFGQGPTPEAIADSVDLEGGDGSSSQVTRRGREVVLQRDGFK